jgi:hypothetical protein
METQATQINVWFIFFVGFFLGCMVTAGLFGVIQIYMEEKHSKSKIKNLPINLFKK